MLRGETWRFLSACMLAVHVLVLRACSSCIAAPSSPLEVHVPSVPGVRTVQHEPVHGPPAQSMRSLLIAYMRRLKTLLMRSNSSSGAPIRALSGCMPLPRTVSYGSLVGTAQHWVLMNGSSLRSRPYKNSGNRCMQSDARDWTTQVQVGIR